VRGLLIRGWGGAGATYKGDGEVRGVLIRRRKGGRDERKD